MGGLSSIDVDFRWPLLEFSCGSILTWTLLGRSLDECFDLTACIDPSELFISSFLNFGSVMQPKIHVSFIFLS